MKELMNFTIINGYFIIPALGVIGFVLNLICLLVFMNSRFKNREKFRYIIVKLLIEMLGCIYFMGFQNYLMCSWESEILLNNPCIDTGSFSFITYRLVMYRYLSHCNYIWSGINEVLINYDKYLMISNRSSLFNRKKNFKFIILSCGIFSHLLFIPNFFVFKIHSTNNETNVFILIKSKLGTNNFFDLYTLIVLGLANVSLTFLIVFTSFMLAKEIKKYSNNATLMHLTVFSKMIFNRRKLEIKLLKMVLILSFIYSLIRIYDFFYLVINFLMIFKLFNNITFYVYFSNFMYNLVIFSIILNIFILIKCNKVFRNTLISYCKNLIPISTIEIVRL